jgi:hypothetical protein
MTMWNMKTVMHNFQDNQRKSFWHLRPLWPWPSDPKMNRGHLLVMTNHYEKYEDFVMHILKKISRSHFDIKGHYDLDLWSSDPKINRGINSLWLITRWNMKTLWWIVFKIINENYAVYRWTDRPTLAKQYTFFEGGHKNAAKSY